MEDSTGKFRKPALRLPKVGEVAPAFSLPATNGQQIDLDSQSRPVALVFMRHLA